ncbi:hypothetical protein P3U72_09945 [Mammaliicoccus sciuri]|nr:hypothetical protein [Mammaliicoccus sciuri]WQJ70520.1 hypothetical protein P3U72_09945 [Mammaliicoccus sciuri]
MSILLLIMIAYFVISMYYTIKAVIETREIDREITVSKIAREFRMINRSDNE